MREMMRKLAVIVMGLAIIISSIMMGCLLQTTTGDDSSGGPIQIKLSMLYAPPLNFPGIVKYSLSPKPDKAKRDVFIIVNIITYNVRDYYNDRNNSVGDNITCIIDRDTDTALFSSSYTVFFKEPGKWKVVGKVSYKFGEKDKQIISDIDNVYLTINPVFSRIGWKTGNTTPIQQRNP
jgi:hypothetical protein